MLRSSIETLHQYRKERLSLLPWGWVVSFLAMAGIGIHHPPQAPQFLLQVFTLIGLIFQFRLWDDLSDLSPDRLNHPYRVLCQSSTLTPFYIAWAVLFATNLAAIGFLTKSLINLSLFLLLNIFFYSWYRIRGHFKFSPLVRSQIILLKYPVFLLLITPLASYSWSPSFVLSSLLVLICFSVFEILHDPKLRAQKNAGNVLIGDLSLFCSVLIFMGFHFFNENPLVSWSIWSLAFISSLFFINHGIRKWDQPLTLGYGVFVFGFLTLCACYIGSLS